MMCRHGTLIDCGWLRIQVMRMGMRVPGLVLALVCAHLLQASPLDGISREVPKTVLAICALTAVGVRADLVGPEAWFEVMGGNFRRDGLRLDLEAIKAAGFSGIHFFHIGRSDTGVWPGCEEQTPCLSEKWDDMVAFLGAECERLGLALTVQNCPGWSQSGGPWVPLSACMREAVFASSEMRRHGAW